MPEGGLLILHSYCWQVTETVWLPLQPNRMLGHTCCPGSSKFRLSDLVIVGLLQVELCKIKLDRATKLIAGLGGEKSRWTAAAEQLGASYEALPGNVLLASAQIAYL